MLIPLYIKYIISLFLTFARPCFLISQTKILTGIEENLYSIAFVTVPSMDVGQTIGRGLVQRKLAASVSIIPQMVTIFKWKNELNIEDELVLMIKTRTSAVNELVEYVRSHHPSELCDVTAVPIKAGSRLYLKWIGDQL